MADKKISALPAATTPLAGTEVLPIVQGGTTDQVTVANLTAGRAVNALSITLPNTEGAVSYTGSGATIGRGAAFATGQAELFTTGTRPLGIGASGAANLNFYTGSIRAFYIDTNQNFVVQTAGKGIDFSANTNAPGMTSELLDWYEEGTWTAGISFGGASVGITYANSVGYYTRVGNLVTVNCYLVLSNKGSSTGAARITGLPFTCVNNASGYSALSVLPINVTFAGQLSGYANINDTTIDLVQSTGINLTDVGFANNSTFIFTQTYRVA